MRDYERLEKEFAEFTKRKYCVVCNSGTAALLIALEAMKHVRGIEGVIIPDTSMAASAFAAYYSRMKVKLVDVDPRGLMRYVDHVDGYIPLYVDLYGRQPVSYKANCIQDAAESHGAASYGEISCYSFYQNKIIHGQEGGAICTDSKDIYEFASRYKSMAFGDPHYYYDHQHIGFNFRMSDEEAKRVLRSLWHYGENARKRRQVEDWYNKYIPLYLQLPKRDAVWVYDVKHDNPQKAVDNLNKQGIPARCYFKPMSALNIPEFVEFDREPTPNAMILYQTRMYLPVYPDMTEEEVKTIAKAFDATLPGKV